VAYFPISETEMAQGVREQGMTESSIQYMLQLFAMVRKGLLAEVTDTVLELTGTPPTSFKEFAKKNTDICGMRQAA
jgi:hypothetical protein